MDKNSTSVESPSNLDGLAHAISAAVQSGDRVFFSDMNVLQGYLGNDSARIRALTFTA